MSDAQRRSLVELGLRVAGQVPALAVLCVLVYFGMQSFQARDAELTKAVDRVEKMHSVTIDQVKESAAVIGKNTETLQRVANVLDRLDRANLARQ